MKTIRIQNYNGCNLNCKVCPFHATPRKGKPMDTTTFNTVLDRLVEYDAVDERYFAVLGHNAEPTIDPMINSRLAEMRQRLSHAILGMHTNGVTLLKDKSVLSHLDYVVVSILGAPSGEFSFSHNTGLDFDKHIDLILELCEVFTGFTVVMLSLPDLTDTERIEEITSRLSGTKVNIILNQLSATRRDYTENNVIANTAREKTFTAIEKEGINKLNFMMSTTIQTKPFTACDILTNDLAINYLGDYDVCCMPGFGKNNKVENVSHTSIYDFYNGFAKKSCRDFIEKNQKVPLISCSDCVLLRTFGAAKYVQ